MFSLELVETGDNSMQMESTEDFREEMEQKSLSFFSVLKHTLKNEFTCSSNILTKSIGP